MAAGVLNKPGVEYGPCESECQHRDCASTREMAATICPLCPDPIGFGRHFYQDDEVGLVHASCLEDALS